MSTEYNAMKTEDTDIKDWTKKTLDKGVYHLIDEGLFDLALIEAKPAWVLPKTLLIGKIRNRGDNNSLSWFICGDCPTLHAHNEVANNPREAARHFSLAWQLKLENEVTSEQKQEHLRQAEALYELVELDHLWLDKRLSE